MNWEQTIDYIRSKEEYALLIEQAYLRADNELNIQSFSTSEEFSETLKLIEKKKPGKLKILDVGCGNGIASISFALKGHDVTAIDPDPSDTVGTGAVEKLKQKLGLKNIEIVTSTAEDFSYSAESFDVIYARQAMHHAYNLIQFISNCARFLKSGGLFVTIRDHVIYNNKDKEIFLNEHPLHKFYHGENAYRNSEYKNAFLSAGLEILEEVKFFDSAINYSPLTLSSIEEKIQKEKLLIRKTLESKLGALGKIPLIFLLYNRLIFDPEILRNERYYSGRMYSYIAKKNEHNSNWL